MKFNGSPGDGSPGCLNLPLTRRVMPQSRLVPVMQHPCLARSKTFEPVKPLGFAARKDDDVRAIQDNFPTLRILGQLGIRRAA